MERQGRAGGRSSFMVEKSDKHYLSLVVKVNINSDVMLIVCTLDMM